MEILNWKYHLRTYPPQPSTDEFQQLILMRGRVHDRQSVKEKAQNKIDRANFRSGAGDFFLGK